jgi:hypothetical protein
MSQSATFLNTNSINPHSKKTQLTCFSRHLFLPPLCLDMQYCMVYNINIALYAIYGTCKALKSQVAIGHNS